jgi:hypothetical protein
VEAPESSHLLIGGVGKTNKARRVIYIKRRFNPAGDICNEMKPP